VGLESKFLSWHTPKFQVGPFQWNFSSFFSEKSPWIKKTLFFLFFPFFHELGSQIFFTPPSFSLIWRLHEIRRPFSMVAVVRGDTAKDRLVEGVA